MINAAMASSSAEASAEFSLLWGIFVPGAILLISVVVTWLLYRHFSKGER